MEPNLYLPIQVDYKEERFASPTLEHFHAAYEIDLIVQAEQQLFLDGKTYQVGERDFVFISENKIHTYVYKLDHPYHRYTLHFQKNAIQPFLAACGAETLLAQLSRKPVAKVSLDPVQFERIRLLLDEMMRLQQKSPSMTEPWNQKLICSNLFLLLDMANRLLPAISPQVSFSNKTQKTVDAVVRYVNENFTEKITLEQLEKQFYLTRFHLCHIFKEETGFTLSTYIQHLRVVEAQRLLRQPKADIAAVCYQCGFPSIQQFYKVFKKITRQTPRQYKQSQAAGAAEGKEPDNGRSKES